MQYATTHSKIGDYVKISLNLLPLFTILSLILISCSDPILHKCIKNYIAEYEKEKHHPDTSQNLPSQLTIRLYPNSDSLVLPENKIEGYNRELGVAVSGGSFRSFSSAIGQIKALTDLEIIKKVGASSFLSGSSWFSTLYNYAPQSIPDSVLLGSITVIPPESLSILKISSMDSDFIGSQIPNMTDDNIIKILCNKIPNKQFPPRRLFSSLFQEIFLKPIGLDNPNMFFSYDINTANEVISLNDSLTVDNFYYMRNDRPFFINSTTIWDKKGKENKMHHFECTPLYFGTQQTIDHHGSYIGGGYFDIIGVNSQTPISIHENEAVINLPDYTFTLFDMMGNCGAAPGSILDRFGIEGLLPEYYYWPVAKESNHKSKLYSFIDGGDLEDLSLIPLLRRGFKKIIVFDNSEYPLGSDSKGCYKGVNYNIARLFGHKPPVSPFNLNNEDIQIFKKEKYDTLRTALFKCKEETGEIPWFIDRYEIVEPNNFGLKKYPNGEKVEILWIYEDMNFVWRDKLPMEIQEFLKKKDKEINMQNFPNFKMVFQNGLQMFELKAEQINLLANMWYYSLREESSLGKAIAGFTKTNK